MIKLLFNLIFIIFFILNKLLLIIFNNNCTNFVIQQESNRRIQRHYPRNSLCPNEIVDPFTNLSAVEVKDSDGEAVFYGFPVDHDPSNSVGIFDSQSKFSGDKYMQSENLCSVDS